MNLAIQAIQTIDKQYYKEPRKETLQEYRKKK